MNKEEAIRIIEAYVSENVSENELYIKEAIECVKGLQERSIKPIVLVELSHTASPNYVQTMQKRIQDEDQSVNVIVHKGEIRELKIINP